MAKIKRNNNNNSLYYTRESHTQMTKKKEPINIWSTFKPIAAKTPNQKLAIQEFHTGKNLVLAGYPGTGKSILALGLSLEEIRRDKYKRILIIRPAVTTGASLGALPGSVKEKMFEFEAPYRDILQKLFGYSIELVSVYRHLANENKIELKPTTHIRGITIDDTILIIDEFQNMTEHEIYSVITRIGNNCRVILAGDIKQSDLFRTKSGFTRLVKTIQKMESFCFVDFAIDDIVRSEMVKEFIVNWMEHESEEGLESDDTEEIQPSDGLHRMLLLNE